MQLQVWKKEHSAEGEKKRSPYSLLVAIFSVFVALVLWFYVQDAEAPDYKKTFSSVAVDLQSLSSSFSVIDGGETRVDITLVGKRSDLNKIKTGDLEAYIDLSSVIQPGSYQNEVSVLVPEGTELSECFPQNVTLFVDQTISKTVPVKVEMGQYTVEESAGIEAVPSLEEISIKGPKTLLDQVEYAKVETGNLGNISASFESNLGYYLVNKNGERVQERHMVLPEANMRVNFTVFKTKTVPLTVECKNGWWKKENMNTTISPKNIVIRGEPALVDAVESIPCLVLDETTVDSTRYSQTLTPSQLVLPEGIRIGEVLGDIKVSLSLSDNTVRKVNINLTSPRVVVTPPPGENGYQFAQPTLTVRVRGSFRTVPLATAEDLYVNIDLSSYTTPGEVEVPVEIIQTSESEGSFYPVGTYTVKVIIS